MCVLFRSLCHLCCPPAIGRPSARCRHRAATSTCTHKAARRTQGWGEWAVCVCVCVCVWCLPEMPPNVRKVSEPGDVGHELLLLLVLYLSHTHTEPDRRLDRICDSLAELTSCGLLSDSWLNLSSYFSWTEHTHTHTHTRAGHADPWAGGWLGGCYRFVSAAGRPVLALRLDL